MRLHLTSLRHSAAPGALLKLQQNFGPRSLGGASAANIRPVPLSVEVKRSGGRFNPVFHSSAIHEEMERRKAEVFGAHAQMQVSHTPFRSRDQRGGRGIPQFGGGQELDVSGASALDESFASVSSFGGGGGVKRPRADNVTLAFPKDMTVCESIYHPAAADSSALETPPAAKRPRFAAAGEGSAAAAAAPLSEAGVKRLARFRQSRCSILSILETPKINKRERRPSAATASFTATPSAAAAAAPTGMATPQSILKMKRLMTAQTPPPAASDSVAKVLDLSGADKEEEEDHENWLVSAGGGARPSARRLLDEVRAMEERRSRESTPSKSIRFSVPKAYPPSQLSREGPAGGAAAVVTEEEVSLGNKERMEESAESYRTVGSPAPDEKLLVAVEEEEEKKEEEVMEVENVADEKEKEEAADEVEEEEVEEVVAAETEETVAEEEEEVEEVAEERSDKAAEEQEETEPEVQVEEEAVKGAEDAAPEEEEKEAKEEKPAEVQEEPSLPSPPKLPSTPEKSRRSASPKSSPAASAAATSAHSPKSPERRGLSARIRYSKLTFLFLDLHESCTSVFLNWWFEILPGL